jgi:transposase
MSSVPPQPIVISPELEAEMTPAVRTFVDTLLVRIAKLEAQLGLNPQNSSLPPSTQHPHAKPPQKKGKGKGKGKGKKRGGQPGHPRHQRPLIPTENCDEVVPLKPTACRRCAAALAGSDPEPLRHQVWEMPPIKPLVTEYQLHRLPCPCCGETTCAALPVGVPRGQSGPRLIAFTALLMAYFRQSKRQTALFLQDLLGQPCCPSLAVKMQHQVAQALEVPYEELRQALAQEPQVHMDESPTKEANQKVWLWTAVAPLFAVFAVFSSRAGTAVGSLLGEAYAGIINCDRAKMYWQAKRLQWCWAHLKRDFQALIDHPDARVKRLGHDLMRQVKLLFQHWWAYRADKISWKTFQARMAPVRAEVNALLLRGVFSGNDRLVGMCEELYKHRDWLWTFVDCQGVEPTNNTAERALRHAVIWRKLSFGTQSAAGSRFVERMLTAIETCRLQKRSTFEYLTAAVEAHLAHRPAPSLAPAP